MPRPGLPAWLRRGLEAALAATVVAVVTLFGNGLAGSGPARDLPDGWVGATIVAPATLALAVIATAYPVAMAATRTDALLGAAAAFLVAADVTLILASTRVGLPAAGIQGPAGLLVAALAIGPAVAGLVGGQLATPFGFGRRAGGWTAVVAAVAALVALAFVAALA